MQPVNSYDGVLEGKNKQVSRKEKVALVGDEKYGTCMMLDKDG